MFEGKEMTGGLFSKYYANQRKYKKLLNDPEKLKIYREKERIRYKKYRIKNKDRLNEYRRELVESAKSLGLCIHCFKRERIFNKSVCPECHEKMRKYK